MTKRLLKLLGLNPSLGARGERAAARHLKGAGYRILQRNIRTHTGEIDILALAPDGRTIVVVEVKTSAAAETGALPPEVHVNTTKQRKLVSLALQVIKRGGWTDRPVRFDVVGVQLPPGQPPVIRHHPGAFESHV